MIRVGSVLIILTFYSNLDISFGRTSSALKVQLPDGSPIVGRYFTSDSGKGIRGFLGIPYAEPPVGNLRFKDPQKKQPWTEVFKAHYNAPICIQRDPFRRDMEIEGSEDCLYLNVYAPESTNVSLPVMVFFHGGGFMCGSGNKDFYGPDFLLEHDVVYIGANYRVGPLGFLSTETEECWGNWGLKDQVQILRWINENIAAFGGDPGRVTIFGESAGGASVTYHMQSKLSKGLFHKGISESGTSLAPWGTVARKGLAQTRAKKLAEMMNCETGSLSNMIECLRNEKAENLTLAFYDFFEWDTDPMVPFPPVVEGEHDSAFITEDPRFKSDVHGNEIPWLTGLTSEEGAMKSSPLIYNEELTRNLIKNWERALPISLYYDFLPDDEKTNLTGKIDEFYFKNLRFTESTQTNLTNLYTDSWFFSPMIDYLRLRFSQKSSPTYVYLFSHKGAASLTEIFKGGSESFYGTSHAEELQYLFPLRKDLKYFFNSIPTEDDKKVTKIITKLWVDFVYYGNPTPNDDQLNWKPTDSFPLDFMVIGNENGNSQDLLKMRQGFYTERADFWTQINNEIYENQWEDKDISSNIIG